MKKNIIQFIKFGIVGVINTFTSYVIVNSCYYLLNLHLQISNIIAFVLSVLVSFSLNSRFVFKKEQGEKRNVFYALGKTYLTYSFTGLFLTAILTEIECNKLGIPLYIASLMNLVITVPINFILNKFEELKTKKEKNINYDEMKKMHSFVICAYKDSEYLEECIKSIIEQEVYTDCMLATSTPSKYIENLCKKYNIPYFVRKGKSDIQDDWNFAYSKAKTELVTIAHQDDIYEKEYTKYILENYKKDILMYNTNYYPYKNGEKTTDPNSKIKNFLKFFTRFYKLSKIKFIRVMPLAFGSCINCPSVTYNKKLLGENVFTSELKFALDWDTYLKIARMDGPSIYIPKKLVNYRIHDNATTMEFLKDNKRKADDIIMFNKIWPKFITKILMKYYVRCYDTYGKEDFNG